MTEQQGHPAGWYRTADGTQEVWFDGQNWTQHARPVVQEHAAPVPPTPEPTIDYGQVTASSQPQNPYGANPYTASQPQAPGYGSAHAGARSYASWIKRVAASLIDSVLVVPFGIVAGILMTVGSSTTVDPSTGVASTSPGGTGLLLGVLAYLAAFGVAIWNQWIRQGKTGYSLGKQALGIRLVKDSTGESTGVLLSIGRTFAHIVDGLICYIGYFWPLWDAKRQTLADKICSTVVIEQPKG